MIRLNQLLSQKEKELQMMIDKVDASNETVLPGELRISNRNGKPKYYHEMKDEKGKQISSYLKEGEKEIARKLAQQDYDKNVIKAAGAQLLGIQQLMEVYDDEKIVNFHSKAHPFRKELIVPVEVSDLDYANCWQTVPYEPGVFSDNDPFFISDRGEKVRSKSEKIIADMYHKMGLFYRYEYPLLLFDELGRPVEKRPDFTILNTFTRQEVYHEHFGRMDDPGYVERNMKKLELYANNGIILGVNLIATLETKNNPIKIENLEKMIRAKLNL